MFAPFWLRVLGLEVEGNVMDILVFVPYFKSLTPSGARPAGALLMHLLCYVGRPASASAVLVAISKQVAGRAIARQHSLCSSMF